MEKEKPEEKLTEETTEKTTESGQAEQSAVPETDKKEVKFDRKAFEEKVAEYQKQLREKGKEANEAMREGKGRLALETPISDGENELTELAYDFTELTGLEYADAMDDDMNAQQAMRITYRQGLALFAAAAAKQTDGLDKRDIIERIGVTDAVEGVQLATLFFNASTRAGRLRISRK